MFKAPNPYRQREPFVGTTVIEIAVPSGRLIASDDLRQVPYFDVDPINSINYGAGKDEWTTSLAERAQVAQAFVGNSCPEITRQEDGSLVVVSTDLDEETEEPILLGNETVVASICTDVWSTMLTDYEHWLSHGGSPVEVANAPCALTKFSVIDVEPGLYRWTVFSNDDTFQLDADGRIEYAKLELIRAL